MIKQNNCVVHVVCGRGYGDRDRLGRRRPGRRAGGGFYDYPRSSPKKLRTGLLEAFPLPARQPDVDELKLHTISQGADHFFARSP